MLRTIRVPRQDGEEDYLFGARPVRFGHKLRRELCVAFDDVRLAPDLDALPMRVVDQEQLGLGIFGKVADRDVLPVASEIGEAETRAMRSLNNTAICCGA